MTFADTYREERLINRRSRARKARIAGRIIGFGLMACFVVALRTDPQLRSLVEDLALAAIGAGDLAQEHDVAGSGDAQAEAIDALGYEPGSREAAALEHLGISGSDGETAPSSSHMPQSRVKVNRGGSG